MAIVGIDLGTTNCVITTMEHGRVEVLQNMEGKLTTPSVVFFQSSELDDVLVGESAVFSLASDPKRAVRYIKRWMGKDFKVKIDEREYTPEEISSSILKKLVRDAEEFLGEKITDAVITVPAWFAMRERDATKKAAELAGLTVRALCAEPIAAAIDFAQTHGEKLKGKTVMVYDLGGGTFDATVMRINQKEEGGPMAFEILGKAGSIELGGAEWDSALAGFVARDFANANGGKTPEDDLTSYENLLVGCQAAKEMLSHKKPEESTLIACTHDGITHSTTITRSQFEEITLPLMNQTINKCSELIEQTFGAGGWDKVDLILLAGGSTKMPAVVEMLTKLSGKEPRTNRGVDLNVARGAAYLAFSPDTWADAGDRESHTGQPIKMKLKSDTFEKKFPLFLVKPDSEPRNRVHFSVISPTSIAPGTTTLVDVWAHLSSQRQQVIERATEESPNRQIQIKTKGPLTLDYGTLLTVRLEIPNILVDPPQDTILWTGEMSNAVFTVTVPENVVAGAMNGRVTVLADGLQLLRLAFLISIGQATVKKDMLRVSITRYQKAFASYASEDRDRVLGRIQGIQKAAPELEIFLDCHVLRSGQNWKKELGRAIEKSDVLYLFWSSAASRSEHVDWEWRHGVRLYGVDFVDPVPLVSPDQVPPPHELAQHHFYDWVLAFIEDRKRVDTQPVPTKASADNERPDDPEMEVLYAAIGRLYMQVQSLKRPKYTD